MSEALTERISHLRHDLRTPLNAILGYSEMVLEEIEGRAPDLAVALRAVHARSKELLALIQERLGAPALGPEVDVVALTTRFHAELHPGCQELQTHCSGLLRLVQEGGFEEVQGDISRIAAAVQNLHTLVHALVEKKAAAPSPETGARLPFLSESAGGDTATDLDPDFLYLLDESPERRQRHGHILVVDDNEMNRNLLARGLHREQHYFALATNGEQALEMLEAGDFDLVLLDILMPGIDGFEVLRRIKAHRQLAHVPVIMISALDEISSVVRCIEMGAADYLPKPFDPVLLRARVNACLEQKRLRDKELDYLRQVGLVTEAAAAMEAGKFQPEALLGVSGRSDALGQLARVFVSMAREVQAREQRLQQQVQQLRIEIDQARKTQQVAEVTASQYFRDLQSKVEQLRRRKPREGG